MIDPQPGPPLDADPFRVGDAVIITTETGREAGGVRFGGFTQRTRACLDGRRWDGRRVARRSPRLSTRRSAVARTRQLTVESAPSMMCSRLRSPARIRRILPTIGLSATAPDRRIPSTVVFVGAAICRTDATLGSIPRRLGF